jgi:microcystin degradation protein MlrC
MGSAFLVVSDYDTRLAEDVLSQLDHYLLDHHSCFQGVKTSVEEAIHALQDLPKPVLLLDMGDNVGGGSPGDSTFLLHALEDKWQGKAFICINDPDVVSELSQCFPGESVEITLGGKCDQRHGLPFTTSVRLINLVDGKFRESEARHGGQVRFDMGPTAIVETSGGTTIMITSMRTVPFSLQQLLHFNVNPAAFDVIVAKGVQAPIAAYAPVCPSLIRVNTDGVTTADMKKMIYHKRRKPLFPFEEIDSLVT